MRRFLYLSVAVIAARSPSFTQAQGTSPGNDDLLIRQLEEFGPIGSPIEAQQTWQAARDALKDKAVNRTTTRWETTTRVMTKMESRSAA